MPHRRYRKRSMRQTEPAFELVAAEISCLEKCDNGKLEVAACGEVDPGR
jgi:hypothetical protein